MLMVNNFLEAIVLAGGKGERMKSETPKVLHEITGRPMVFYTLEKLIKLGVKNIIVVVGYKAVEVKKAIELAFHLGGVKLKFAHQANPIGTADAVKAALLYLNPKTEKVLITNGDDSAFYSLKTLLDFLASHTRCVGIKISAITTIKQDVGEIGRIIRDKNGDFEKALEFNEYQKSGLNSDEINCGAYIFDKEWLEKNISKVQKNPQKGEYYLTELLNIARIYGEKINLFKLKNPDEWLGINTPEDLEKAHALQKNQ